MGCLGGECGEQQSQQTDIKLPSLFANIFTSGTCWPVWIVGLTFLNCDTQGVWVRCHQLALRLEGWPQPRPMSSVCPPPASHLCIRRHRGLCRNVSLQIFHFFIGGCVTVLEAQSQVPIQLLQVCSCCHLVSHQINSQSLIDYES